MRKSTGFMSNGARILDALRKRCGSRDGTCTRAKGGRHVTCSGKVAADAARYSPGLCKAILRGISNQLHQRGVLRRHEVGLHAVDDEAIAENHLRGPEQGYSGKHRDDVTGQVLHDDLVKEARLKELDYFNAKGVWRKRLKVEAFKRTGRQPITVRWVDVNKGDDLNPRYRSRLVARQLKAMDRSGQSFFAPTPPLEALRTVLSFAATKIGTWAPCYDPTSERRMQLGFLDISRAYFNAKIDGESPTFVQLPAEDEDSGTMCAELQRHMYGTRAAADGWQEEYSSTLVSHLGFAQGVSSPCIFRHPDRELIVTVHGDDFTSAGACTEIDWFEESMKEFYELTTQPRLGPGPDDAKEAIVLNRVVRWTDDGIEYEADPRQVEKLIIECGLQGTNSVATPGVRASFEETENDQPLDDKAHTPFRGAAARANYFSADRIDCQFAAKEVCRWMSSPTKQSWLSLKRLCRYLVGLPRLVFLYRWQTVEALDVFTDTDWAGCPRTRKSTSGGCVLLGGHTIKSWSSTQSSVALSSGEAEFNGVVRGAGIGLGYQSILRDLGQEIPIRVWTDSSASIGICTRQGLGKLRHLDTHTLWIQQAVRSGRVDLRKIAGEVNPADLFTKHSLSRDRVVKLTNLFDCQFRGGRAESAPKTGATTGTKSTMADQHIIAPVHRDGEDDPIMPPRTMTATELDLAYPPMAAPAAVDTADPQDPEDDPLLKEGVRLASEIWQAASVQGRRRKMKDMATTSSSRSWTVSQPRGGRQTG